MSHPPGTVNTMHYHHAANEALAETCGRAEAANVAAVSDLPALVEGGLSRAELGRIAETAKRMEAGVSSLKCAIAGELSRTGGGARAEECCGDQLGATNYQAKQLSKVAEELDGSRWLTRPRAGPPPPPSPWPKPPARAGPA